MKWVAKRIGGSVRKPALVLASLKLFLVPGFCCCQFFADCILSYYVRVFFSSPACCSTGQLFVSSPLSLCLSLVCGLRHSAAIGVFFVDSGLFHMLRAMSFYGCLFLFCQLPLSCQLSDIFFVHLLFTKL